MLGLLSSSKLEWASHIVAIAKTASKTLEPQLEIQSIKFFILKVALYLYKSSIWLLLGYIFLFFF